MTNFINDLTERGLVEREKNPDDGRSSLIKLSEKGNFLRKSVPSLDQNFGNCCDTLSSSEVQLLNFLLKKVNQIEFFGENNAK